MIDVVGLGELLIDFTENGISEKGNPLFEANPGGAPPNVLAMLRKLDKSCAFIGKVGEDMFGRLDGVARQGEGSSDIVGGTHRDISEDGTSLGRKGHKAADDIAEGTVTAEADQDREFLSMIVNEVGDALGAVGEKDRGLIAALPKDMKDRTEGITKPAAAGGGVNEHHHRFLHKQAPAFTKGKNRQSDSKR